MIAVLILPISVVWGSLYLGFGSPAGVIPFVYFAVSLGSLVIFARTRRFHPFLVTQLLDILFTTTAGMMVVGGFLPPGRLGCGASWPRSGPWSSSRCVRPCVGSSRSSSCSCSWASRARCCSRTRTSLGFTSTMLALNVIGAGAVAFTLLAVFADQRNAALTALRAEQEKSSTPREHPAGLDRRPTEGRRPDDRRPLRRDLHPLRRRRGLHALSQRLSPAETVDILDRLFSHFDSLVERHGLEKIKTVGDCYMAAAGVPDPHRDHARRAALLALDMREAVATSAVAGREGLELRIGINSGPVVAGVIGRKRFLYDLWSDAVNTASRMESHGTPGEIQITRETYELLKDEFVCRRRGTIPVKGKGEMETWYLVGSRSDDRRTDGGVGSEAAGTHHHDRT